MRQTTAIVISVLLIIIASICMFSITELCIKTIKHNFTFETIIESTLVWATSAIMIIVILLVLIAVVLAMTER